MLNFEWDENKRLANLSKHGIDFIAGMRAFNDPEHVLTKVYRREECRYQLIGSVDGVVLSIIYIVRNKRNRLISVRRASRNERKKYYNL